MIFSPSQPVNLPLSTKERLALCGTKSKEEGPIEPIEPIEPQDYVEEMEDLPRCSADTASRVFGEISFITKNLEGFVTGLWFGDSLKVYVPITPISNKKLLSLPVGESNPFEVERDISVQRLNKMKKDLSFIQQIFWWLYTLHMKYYDGDTAFWDFVERYVSFDNDYDGDSAFYYDLLGIRRIFPTVNSVDDAILDLAEQEAEFLSPGYNTLFLDGRIRFYNRHSSTSKGFGEKMVKWLEKKVGLEQGKDKPFKIPESIQNFYNSSKDFEPQPHVTIFVGREELRKWINSVEMGEIIHKIHKKITSELSLSTEPFIVQDSEDGKIYYIQNVAGGSKARALNVSRMWTTQRINGGWTTPPIDRDYPHIVYGDVSYINSTTSSFGIIEDNRMIVESGEIQYINIPVILSTGKMRLLQYNTTPPLKYAAMLELL